MTDDFVIFYNTWEKLLLLEGRLPEDLTLTVLPEDLTLSVVPEDLTLTVVPKLCDSSQKADKG